MGHTQQVRVDKELHDIMRRRIKGNLRGLTLEHGYALGQLLVCMLTDDQLFELLCEARMSMQRSRPADAAIERMREVFDGQYAAVAAERAATGGAGRAGKSGKSSAKLRQLP